MKFFQAVLILSGLIIGAGMFGIPYAFSEAGFWLGVFELFVLSGVILWLHLLYGEIVFATAEAHRLPGYVRKYLGARAFFISQASAILGITGSLLAYIILGAVFLGNIANFGFSYRASGFFWAIVFAAAGGIVVRFPVRQEAFINSILTAILIAFVVILTAMLVPRVVMENISGFHVKNAVLPYGILLFALAGGAAVPDLVLFLGKERSVTRRAIVVGTLIPPLLYLFFALGVVGVSGANVSREAIAGLSASMGNTIVLAGSVIGLLAVFTSYIVLGMSYEALLRLDMGRSALVAWAGAAFVPFVLYAMGFQNFIAVIGLVGALGIGVDSALIVASYHALRKTNRNLIFMRTSIYKYSFYFLIAAGVIFEVYSFFS